MEIQLTLDREQNCWKTVTLSGLGKGTEIWTHAIPTGENQIKVVVDFFVPKLPSFLKAVFAPRYQEVYKQLYKEDLMMMQGRQSALNFLNDRNINNSIQKTDQAQLLGNEKDIRNVLPMNFEFENKPYCLVQHDNKLTAFSSMCPHMLGPLNEGNLHNGVVECPWHGYKFDIVSGEAVNGHKCKLNPAPNIFIDSNTGNIFAKLQE